MASILFLGIHSCIKDSFDLRKLTGTDWQPTAAFPLINSSLSIEKMVKPDGTNSSIQFGSDKLVTLIYRGNLFSLKASDFVTIPNQSQQQDIILTGAQILQLAPVGATVTQSTSQVFNFNASTGVEVDSIIFSAGTLALTLSSTLKHNLSVVITIPSAKKNGVPISQTVNLTYSGSVPFSGTANIDLAGCNFDMTNGGTAFNQFLINYSATVTSTGQSVNPTDKLTITFALNDSKFQKIHGYIGQQSVSPPTSTIIYVTLFAAAEPVGIFTLRNPYIKMYITNSYGVPVTASFDTLKGYNSNPADSIGLTFTLPPNNPKVFPIPTPSQPGTVANAIYTLDSSNSTIRTYFNVHPKYFMFHVTTLTNPPPKQKNFILDTSRLALDVELYLPLYGSATIFDLRDTFDYKFDALDEIEYMNFRVKMINAFPMEAFIQAYFADYNYVVLDSLMTPGDFYVEAAQTNITTGVVTAATEKTIDISIPRSKINNILKGTKVIIKAKTNTSNYNSTNPAPEVKIFADSKIDVKLGAVVKFKTKIDNKQIIDSLIGP